MLAKKYRLTKKGSFNYVYKKGTPSYSSKITMLSVPSKGSVKIGFSVSNKIGCAVLRNKVKRRMRAAVQCHIGRLNGCQAVFVAKKGIEELDYRRIEQEIYSCLKSSSLIKPEKTEKP